MTESIRQPLGQKARILIVEDEDFVMRSIVIFTRRIRDAVEIVMAITCDEGLLCMEQQAFDAVLTDFNGPSRANGNDVAARAKELGIPKITIMTGGHADLVKPGFDIMHKPMDSEQLRVWFGDAVKIALKRQELEEKISSW